MRTQRGIAKQISRWAWVAALVFATTALAPLGTLAVYSVSGTVRLCSSGGEGLVNVQVRATCSGQTTRTGTTNSSGAYTITNLTTGKTYTLTPILTGYTFTPATRSVSSAVSGQDFVATPTGSIRRSISGTVTSCGSGLGGVTVSTDTGQSATTNASGAYTISNVPTSCTARVVTPTRTGFTFAPASQSVMVTTSNVMGIDFIATPPDLSISGTVTDCSGNPLSGVEVSLDSGATVLTGSDGTYSFTGVAPCTTYVVTPSAAGYAFTPASTTVNLQSADVTGVDFTGVSSQLTISGRVTLCDGSGLSGVTVSTDTGVTATTDIGGNYILTGLTGNCSGVTYTVTPTLSGYTFSPTNQAVVLTGGSAVNVNFAETPPTGTFSISGTVTGCSGSGVNGVAVLSSGGQSATTNSSGAYTLTGLAPCTTYTITPVLSGTTFWPGSKSIRLGSANVTGVNFTSTSDAVGAWDPLRQISQQIVRPNLLIIQDISGSMAWDVNGQSVGVDSTGTSPTAAWSARYSDDGSTWTSGTSGSHRYWRYTLTVTQTYPSRMATVKNALGKWVNIITPWLPPDTWTSDTGYNYIKNANANWVGPTIAGPTVGNTTSTHTFLWQATYTTARTAPGNPFTAYDASAVPTVGSGAVSISAQDLVGRTANKVNWGLETFSGTTNTIRVYPDSADTGNVTSIENLLKLSSASGLGASGSTPTRNALLNARGYLQNVHGGGDGLTADPKKTCGRTYGVVLVTDGLSNNNNPGDDNWISPCASDCATDPEHCCDAGSSGYNCPDSYTLFPAGAAEDLWNYTWTDTSTAAHIRTWAIGISKNVNRCEMNMDAYMGRTDASSPNGDAGFATSEDPYLPTATGDMAHYQPNVGGHKDYAYFATSATALASAFAQIVAAAATGDYSTAAPVVSSAISGGSDIVYVASAQYPQWKGHFYAYDEHDPANPILNWDAGKMLAPTWTDAQGATRGRNFVNEPRVIYTWDSSNNLVNLGAYSDASSLASVVTLPTGFNSAVLDFVKGFDGTRTNVQRSWVLGPILNSTAAVFSAPEAWKPNSLPDHKSFETAYARRHALVVVGSSDGMFHFFDVADGFEVYAILPPSQLANQILLYNNYLASNGIMLTGEPVDVTAHIYGTASPPRFADVYMTSDSSYHTVLVLSEGKGGTTLAGIDVTHSYPGRTGVVLPYDPPSKTQDYAADPNCDTTASPSGTTNYSSLVNVVWAQTSSSLSGLGQTWSVPAMGATSSSNFDCVLGSGYVGCTTYTPKLFSLNAATGSTRVSSALTNGTGALVQNQAYGAGALFNTTAEVPKNYDVQNLGVIADTNGRVWFVVPSSGSVVKAVDVGATQPIYYTPAVGYLNNKDIYAFASGNFYEGSTAITSSSTFTPTLYVVVKSADAAAANMSTDVYSVALKNFVINASTNTKLGAKSQVSADPVLFIPASSSDPVKAFFLVYDPQAGTCVGTSYLVELDVPSDLGTGWKSSVTQSSQSLGEGVASGVAFSGGKIIVARSAIGSGQVTPQVAGTGPSPLGEAPVLSSWIELK